MVQLQFDRLMGFIAFLFYASFSQEMVWGGVAQSFLRKHKALLFSPNLITKSVLT